jgi:hypothetical protein
MAASICTDTDQGVITFVMVDDGGAEAITALVIGRHETDNAGPYNRDFSLLQAEHSPQRRFRPAWGGRSRLIRPSRFVTSRECSECAVVRPREAALAHYAVTRSSFPARTSVWYSRPVICGRAKCQVNPWDRAQPMHHFGEQ